MRAKKITERLLTQCEQQLRQDEKSEITIEKYLRDCRAFMRFAAAAPISKETVIAWKQQLVERGYAPRSVNSMLAAVNSLLGFAGLESCRVKALRIQREIYCPEEKELSRAEYLRLVRAAEARRNLRLSLTLQTICSTGIRISELRYITVEAAGTGEARVSCKGKTRVVFLPRELQLKLRRYAKVMGVEAGPLFLTSGGKPLSRSNVWREMKSLCADAGVLPGKVFPHNLRHLFARVFYKIEKDIVKLADILGHSSINTTRIYIISSGAEHRSRIERMRLIPATEGT